jgi:hypothetical protein
MSDIFREVDEALQQEKVAKVWNEYAPTIVAAAILMILTTAATTGWISWNAHRNATETGRLVQAIENGDSAATKLQEVAEDTRGNHEAVALLTAAGILGDKKEYEQAAALYQKAYEDRSAPRELRELSRILYVRSQLAAGKTTDAAPLLDVLKPVLASEKSPWIWQAKIDAALIAAHLGNDKKAAAAYLQGVDEATNVPPSLLERAQALLQLYTAEGGAVPAEAKKDQQG